MRDSAPPSLIETFVFVVWTPYKALFLEAWLKPPPHRAPPVSSHPQESQIPPSKKGEKRGAGGRYSELQHEGVRGPTAAHPDTRARTVSALYPFRPAAASARRPSPAPSLRPPWPPSPSGAVPASVLPAQGAMAAAQRGPAGRLGGRVAGPRPGRLPGLPPRAPSSGLAPQLLPRLAPQAPAAASRPLSGSPARSLSPSLGRAAALSRLRSVQPRVTAPAADSPLARAHGGARAARARRPGRARRPQPRARPAPARAASWFRPARAREPRGPSAPTPRPPWRGPEPPQRALGGRRRAQPLFAERGRLGRLAPGPGPRASSTCCFVWVGSAGPTVVVLLIGTPLCGPPTCLRPG